MSDDGLVPAKRDCLVFGEGKKLCARLTEEYGRPCKGPLCLLGEKY